MLLTKYFTIQVGDRPAITILTEMDHGCSKSAVTNENSLTFTTTTETAEAADPLSTKNDNNDNHDAGHDG